VDDTDQGIIAGLHAGCWTVGIAKTVKKTFENIYHKTCIKIIANLRNQNKRRVWLNKSISLHTLQYSVFTHTSLLHSRKVQDQRVVTRYPLTKGELKDNVTQ